MRPVGRLRRFYTSYRPWILGGSFFLLFLLGMAGWLQTDPDLRWWDAAYRSVGLFVLEFDVDGDPAPLLDVMRFLAPLASSSAIAIVVLRVISASRTLARASRLRGHVVIVGSGPEVSGLASRWSGTGADVVVLGALTPAAVGELEGAGTLHLATIADDALGRVLRDAARVVVLEATDHDAVSTLRRLRQHVVAPTRVTVVFSDPDLAAHWASGGDDQVVSRSTQVASALLRDVPPYPALAVAPPPIVIGDGVTAAEIARIIVVGWQEPGESRAVDCLGADQGWVEAVKVGVAKRANLRFHPLAPPAASAPGVVGAVLATWRKPQRPERYALEGPRVYVSYTDAARTITVASAVAEAQPTALVVALVPDAEQWSGRLRAENLRIVAERDLLTDPARLVEGETDRLEAELVAEATRWPGEEPTVLGDVGREPESIAARAAAVAQVALEALTAVGVQARRGVTADTQAVVLAPEHLLVVADRIAAALGQSLGNAAGGLDPARLRLLELAARLPVLVARTGLTPVRIGGAEVFGVAEVADLARATHTGYLDTATATGNATGSANAQRAWVDLSEEDRFANVAHVLDIPVKLAILGLTITRVEDGAEPASFSFTAEQVELLAEVEHRRWAHVQIRNGRPRHQFVVPWDELTDGVKQYDRDPILALPARLASVGREIVPIVTA